MKRYHMSLKTRGIVTLSDMLQKIITGSGDYVDQEQLDELITEIVDAVDGLLKELDTKAVHVYEWKEQPAAEGGDA